jgi:hypothetical protein
MLSDMTCRGAESAAAARPLEPTSSAAPKSKLKTKPTTNHGDLLKGFNRTG